MLSAWTEILPVFLFRTAARLGCEVERRDGGRGWASLPVVRPRPDVQVDLSREVLAIERGLMRPWTEVLPFVFVRRFATRHAMVETDRGRRFVRPRPGLWIYLDLPPRPEPPVMRTYR